MIIKNVGLENAATLTNVRNQGEPAGYKMSEDEKLTLQKILSKYDPDNLTKEEGKEMRNEIKAAGILPGRELGTALENAGFEIKKPEESGGIHGSPPPHHRPGPKKLSEYQKEMLGEILAKYDPGDFSEEDDELLREELEDAGIFPGRELGNALNKVGFGIRIHPNGIIVDDTI